MSKELDYINKRIEKLEFQIAHPTEYNITPVIKVKINDGAVYKEEVAILKIIKERLEVIDQAESSEALKCLENLCDEFPILKKDYKIISQALLKSQEQEKVLEIIFEKKVMIEAIITLNLHDYNDLVSTDEQLTPEESDIVKRWYAEWLKN